MSCRNWPAFIAMQTCANGGPVPLVEGLPGAAKTAVFASVASQARRHFVQCILRQKAPEDAGGIPQAHEFTDIVVGKTIPGVKFLLGEEMLRAKHEKCLMLLDELNHAGHDTLGSFQEWINSPPENCWMVACQNPVESSTSGVELSPPVINRMCKLEWEDPREQRREGWRNGFMNYPEPEFPLLPADWTDLRADWGDRLCEFEDKFPFLFSGEGYPKDESKACDPWPSNRSWTHVGVLMAACDAVFAPMDVRSKLVMGCVGEAAGTDFLNHIGYADLPNPEDLLARADLIELPNRFDKVRAILAGLLHAVDGNPTPDRWESLRDCVEVIWTQNQEAAMTMEGSCDRIRAKRLPHYDPRLRNGRWAEMQKARLAVAEV